MTCEAAIAERRVVINADDFGLTEGVTRGILEAHRAGAVTAASMFANAPGFASALAAAHQAPALELGLHFNLTVGRPVARAGEVASLCDADGRFLPLGRLIRRTLAGRVDSGHVARECHAQLERLRSHGMAVTHLDSHRHVHVLPGIWPGVSAVGAQEGLALRVPVEPLAGGRASAKLAVRLAHWTAARLEKPARPARHFRGIGLLGTWRYAEALMRILDELPPGGTEIMVHPGYVDAELVEWDGYVQDRECELVALRSPQVLTRLTRGDFTLGRFGDL
ncbi:MAG TPA: ChbG/HpnK family deacetylase [Gemmatimonadales bacterium]|nr:ChbG/HpnK family deacetylase [Gemmatimonadales bacterium]